METEEEQEILMGLKIIDI